MFLVVIHKFSVDTGVGIFGWLGILDALLIDAADADGREEIARLGSLKDPSIRVEVVPC